MYNINANPTLGLTPNLYLTDFFDDAEHNPKHDAKESLIQFSVVLIPCFIG